MKEIMIGMSSGPQVGKGAVSLASKHQQKRKIYEQKIDDHI